MNTDQYNNIPLQLRQLKRWTGHKEKKPVNPLTGNPAQSNNPDTWGTFEEALAAVTTYKLDGLEIMLGDGLCGVDIDHCIAQGGTVATIATEIINAMSTYTEKSLSGTGVHMYFTGAIDEAGGIYKKNPKNGVEIYSSGRPFVVTGDTVGQFSTVENRTEQVKAIQQKYMQRAKKEPPQKREQRAPTTIKLSDEDVIRKASTAKNADEFSKLWSGDYSGYNSQSEADLALCNNLAFYCGTDADQIDRLFRQSGLMRDKWNDHPTYAKDTVQNAIASCPNTYRPSSGTFVVEDGKLYRKTSQNGTQYLANFVAFPLSDITKDNGAETAHFYSIGGTLCTGAALPTVILPAGQFASMRWLDEKWGMAPCIEPGNNNLAYVGNYIRSQAAAAPRKTVYTHTGFRVINDKLCYLHHGGAIGTDNVECELAGDLSRYTFTAIENISERDALQEVMNLFKIAPPKISYPLLAFTYLAPLNYFLKKAGISSEFCLFNIGTTGSFKTALSKLYLAHFHTYNGMDEPPPANFSCTQHALEKMTFDLKDMPLLVDDYHPTTAKDKIKMDEIVQRLARSGSDHSGRVRMNSDTSLRAAFAPRGLTIITGEDTPDIAQSGLARNYFVRFEKGDINADALTECQEHATELNVAMQGFIKWLIANADDLPKELKEEGANIRRNISIENSHARTAPTIACLYLAVWCFSYYAHSVGLFTKEQAATFCDGAEAVFVSSSAEQAIAQTEEAPAVKFLVTLDALLQSQTLVTEEIGAEAKDAVPPFNRIGYHDSQFYYILSSKAYAAVKQAIEAGGCGTFPSDKKVYADLAKAGYIETYKGKSTRNIWVPQNGTRPRCLCLKKSALDGLKEFEENEQ